MQTRRQILTLFATTPVIYSLSAGLALAKEPDIFQNPIAINGTDPVAYFTDGKPVRGSASNKLKWMGAEWRFANADNAKAFKSNPNKYAPEFGGYCAYAASRGYLAPTIPEAWKIHNGKLYLNASLRALELWSQDIPGNIAAGLKNWPGILSA